MKTIKTHDRMTKGELMKLVFTPDQLSNIDTAIPLGSLPEGEDSYFYVMDYNDNKIGGKLTDMRQLVHIINFEFPQYCIDKFKTENK